MISTLEKEITFRFLKARKKDGFLNIISIFSFIGIGLGVAVLIIVMSVMNGFRTELINKIVGFNPHITVKPYDNQINIEKLKKSNLNLISDVLKNLRHFFHFSDVFQTFLSENTFFRRFSDSFSDV